MSIYERLTQDHDKQKELAARLIETTGDSADRQRLFNEFKTEAEAHANAEEQTFYAMLMEKPEGQEQARHSVAEHKDAADLLEELAELDMASGGWIRKFEKLKDEMEHHIEEEEKDMFELAQSLLDTGTEEQLADDFDQRKSAEKG